MNATFRIEDPCAEAGQMEAISEHVWYNDWCARGKADPWLPAAGMTQEGDGVGRVPPENPCSRSLVASQPNE